MRMKLPLSIVAMSRFVAVALLVAVVVGTPTTERARCNCEATSPINEALAEADAVFAGPIVATRVLPDSYRMTDDSTGAVDELEVTVEVTRWWKGAGTPQAVVRTIYECCLCGYPFEKDQSYLIYAWEDRETPGRYRTRLCLRTKPLDEAREEMDHLTTLIE